VYFSQDGQRRREELLNVSHKKRRLNPSNLSDALGSWIPTPEQEFTEENALEPPPEIVVDLASVLGKRKEYVSTVSAIPAVFYWYSSSLLHFCFC
jgi:hypothetical protein